MEIGLGKMSWLMKRNTLKIAYKQVIGKGEGLRKIRVRVRVRKMSFC